MRSCLGLGLLPYNAITHSVKKRQLVELVCVIGPRWGLRLCRSPESQEFLRCPCCFYNQNALELAATVAVIFGGI
ncbi:hypothetical protein TNCV_1736501 [Trichonephila clavipes]|nr:hypothetical protein TNCV_1736501 [Trichonephila clavipes]